MLQCAEKSLRILSWSVPLLVASAEWDFGLLVHCKEQGVVRKTTVSDMYNSSPFPTSLDVLACSSYYRIYVTIEDINQS
jgi:hypothetical protein